jgi:ATP-dependent helicase/DNAse subunit B
MSEGDRLMARPKEFAEHLQTVSAMQCWEDWHKKEVTPHDGLVRPNHPIVLEILSKTQSASSLTTLLTNPLGYLWKYALHFDSPKSEDETGFALDNLTIGSLVHDIADRALREISETGTLGKADPQEISDAVAKAAIKAAEELDRQSGLPPEAIWHNQFERAKEMARRALAYRDESMPNATSWSEVPFGGAEPKHDGGAPWEYSAPVTIRGTEFDISGYMDRIDIAEYVKRAHVVDYKIGAVPDGDFVLNKGRELQRCLYAYAVKEILGPDVDVSSVLFYVKADEAKPLVNPDLVLSKLAEYLAAARASFTSGKCLVGPNTGGNYDDRKFALPAASSYLGGKKVASQEEMGDAALIWDEEWSVGPSM